jgi:predicted MPP superfamily phosphohydrolase
VNITGVDYLKTESRENFSRVLGEIIPLNIKNMPTILLKHVPSNLDIAESAGIALSLHGHTHNGQIWPLGYVARGIFGKFYLGYSRLNNLQVFTTSGVGTWGPPQRFLTNSEIVEITFN